MVLLFLIHVREVSHYTFFVNISRNNHDKNCGRTPVCLFYSYLWPGEPVLWLRWIIFLQIEIKAFWKQLWRLYKPTKFGWCWFIQRKCYQMVATSSLYLLNMFDIGSDSVIPRKWGVSNFIFPIWALSWWKTLQILANQNAPSSAGCFWLFDLL